MTHIVAMRKIVGFSCSRLLMATMAIENWRFPVCELVNDVHIILIEKQQQSSRVSLEHISNKFRKYQNYYIKEGKTFVTNC